MKALITILAAALLFSSCTATRHTTSTAVAVHDTVTATVHDTLHDVQVHTNTLRIHDTVIKEVGYEIHRDITPEQLAPTHTAKGVAVPRTYYIDTGNLHVRLTADATGVIAIDAWDDSSTIIIQNLRDQLTTTRDSLSRVQRSTAAEKSIASATITSLTEKTRWPAWLKWGIGIVALLLVIEVVARLYKKFV